MDRRCSFEWLTSCESLDPVIARLLDGKKEVRVLHVGCGTSRWGHHLLERFPQHVVFVFHVDKEQQPGVCCVNFRDGLPTKDETFGLVLDKSTLDCTLCSDHDTAALLCEVYRNLTVGGIYVVVSFHPLGFLVPLLRDCPGANWTVSHHIIQRQVEDLIQGKNNNNNNNKSQQPNNGVVQIVLCEKNSPSSLDRHEVQEHVHRTNDEWYQTQNPLLSVTRTEWIREQFRIQDDGGSSLLPLPKCFRVLFTEEEREHLTYKHFMEDWDAYCSSDQRDSTFPKDAMSAETALDFLREMQ